MNPAKVNRANVKVFTDLPNIGNAMAGDFILLGLKTPEDFTGADAVQLYEMLCDMTGVRHDPCVLDVFMSVVSFMNGEPAKPWWEFTALRKKTYRGKYFLRTNVSLDDAPPH